MNSVPGASGGDDLPADQLPWRFRTINLRSASGWRDLLDLLSGKRDDSPARNNHVAAQAIISQLKKLEVKSAIVEFPYHDRDFSEDYAAFYSRLFRPGRRACVRVHFFTTPSEDISTILSSKVAHEHRRLREIRGLKDRGVYRGFCVCRPIRDTPLGFTAIARPKSRSEHDLQLWTSFSTHVLGERFEVNGFPFIEQDGRTGACAQAALWMALRFLWAAEDGHWSSMHSLSAAATAVTDETNALSVPSGSGGLNPQSMLTAVRSAGRIPHYFTAANALKEGHLVIKWKNELDPIAITCRYLDSNIPVILLLGHTTSRLSSSGSAAGEEPQLELMEMQNGHAVTAVGYQCDLDIKVPAATGEDHLHVASWVKNLVVHNDQVGPYVTLPTSLGLPLKTGTDDEYTSADIFGIIVPLPEKVYLSSDRAEEFAWMFVSEKADEWLNELSPGAVKAGTSVLAGLDRKNLVARTFLTRGYNHYQWLSDAQAHPAVLEVAAALHFPRYVWITEFYLLEKGVPDFAHTVAHIVGDATATSTGGRTKPYSAFLFGHLPGWVMAVLTTGYRAGAKIAAHEIENDRVYKCFNLTIDQKRRQQRQK